jgi:hypothetical protein
MMVVHVASDAFVGTVSQGHFLAHEQVKVKLFDESNILLANNSLASAPTASISTYSYLLQSIQLQWGSSLVRVLTCHNYRSNHSHPDRQVALAFRRIQWHNRLDHCVGHCIGHLLLCDKDNANQQLHKACAGGPSHLQTSVVHGT